MSQSSRKLGNFVSLFTARPYHECTGADVNCHIINGVLTCDPGYRSSCILPLTSDCVANCRKYHECTGTDINCHTRNGHLTCDPPSYRTSCNLPLTADCTSNCRKYRECPGTDLNCHTRDAQLTWGGFLFC